MSRELLVGPLGSHGRNWAPAETIADYLGNCREGLETWSERRAAELLGCKRIELYRWKRMAELPEDLFEALLTSGSKPPSSRELANIARALGGSVPLQPSAARMAERCCACGMCRTRRNREQMAVHPATVTDTICLWCGKGFTARRDGGKRQVFCCPFCRRAFDATGRQWVAEAIATGVLTVDAIKNSPTPTRALV
jgi:hypothetical protein